MRRRKSNAAYTRPALVSQVAESWLLKSAGAVLGGTSGWVVSSSIMERAAARGNSLAAYARVPAAATGALFSASLAAELARPAVLGGKRVGSVINLGLEARPLRHDFMDPCSILTAFYATTLMPCITSRTRSLNIRDCVRSLVYPSDVNTQDLR